METGCDFYSSPTGVFLERFKRNLGKVVPTPCGSHDRFKRYERLSLVRDEDTLVAYISKQCVPEGVEITNREYWQPMNVVGYADGGVIILKDRDHTGQFITYTLEEAVKSIAEVSRKPGALLTFLTQDEEGAVHWEIWQYNNINNYEWENLEHWRSVYNDVSKFIGWYNNLDELLRVYVGTYTGKYAIVGEELRDAAIYEGRSDGWYKLDDNPYEKFMHDLIYQILNGTLDLTDEEKAAFKAFMCGGELDECGEFGCCDDGVGPAGRVYTKFKVRTDLADTTFDLHIAYPEPHYANNGHEITWEAAQLVDLDFDFISGTWYERKNKGVSIDADEELNLGSCFIELINGDSGEELSSIKMSVDRGDEYVYNSEENPWYKTYTRTEIVGGEEVEVTKEGIFLPCDGQYHFIAFSKLSKDEPDMDVYNMKFIIDNTHTEDAEIKLRYYRKDVNPASCYTTHSYKYITVSPNEYYEGMTESQILDWETNTEVNEATEQIIGCFNSRLAGAGFQVTVTKGDVAAIVVDKIYYEGNEEWCAEHGLIPTEEENIKGYIFIRLIYAEPETKYAYTIKNLTDYDVYMNVNGIEDKRIKANWYYEFDRYEDITPVKITSDPITIGKEGENPVVYDWVINNIVTTEAVLRYGKAYITLRARDGSDGHGGDESDTQNNTYNIMNNTGIDIEVSISPLEGHAGETITGETDSTETINTTYSSGTITVVTDAPEGYSWLINGSEGSTANVSAGDVDIQLIVEGDTSATYYTLYFNSNGGSAIQPQIVTTGETPTVPEAPTREGYVFNGWYLNGSYYDFTTPIDESATLKAYWVVDLYNRNYRLYAKNGLTSDVQLRITYYPVNAGITTPTPSTLVYETTLAPSYPFASQNALDQRLEALANSTYTEMVLYCEGEDLPQIDSSTFGGWGNINIEVLSGQECYVSLETIWLSSGGTTVDEDGCIGASFVRIMKPEE